GTTVERTARKFNTSTVAVVARLTSWVVYLVAVLVALEVAGYIGSVLLVLSAGNLLPNVLVAVIVLVVGLLLADKIEVRVSEALRSVKVPEIGLIPTVVRYTVVFVAILVALAQIGISVTALVVLFGAYVFAAVIFAAVAFRHLLGSAAVGLYLLLDQPYGIGDRIAVGDREGVVQEVDVFVTRIEADGREYIVPNHIVFRDGAVRIRD
ncbi:MAG: mechanosensitive ion channel domain-containing protein, partial [Halanaeroarchaeum sp.]